MGYRLSLETGENLESINNVAKYFATWKKRINMCLFVFVKEKEKQKLNEMKLTI